MSEETVPTGCQQVLTVLRRQDVEHVLVGELAAATRGCRVVCNGVSIVPARYGRNLDRLLAALRELEAKRLEGESTLTRLELDKESLRSYPSWSLVTEAADVEIDFEPPGTGGYTDLYDDSRPVTLAPGVRVQVASAPDLARMAEASELPRLRALLPGLRSMLGHPPELDGEISVQRVEQKEHEQRA